jgi:SynChlorMet cassette radical SAM/SPASM protein ScmF
MSFCNVPRNKSSNEAPLDLPEGMPSLRSFYLYMSSVCNLKCRHCWIRPTYVSSEPSPGDVLDVHQLHEAVTKAKPMGLSFAKLTGGEPMLHPQFMKIAEMLTHMGLKLSMETNGTLITAPSARHLKEKSNVNFISVSLDGANSKTHDEFRGVSGAFDAALRGLGHLVNAGYENMQLIMSVHRGNLKQIDDLVTLAADRGAKTVKISPVTKVGRGTVIHERGEALDFDESFELSRYVFGPLQKKSPIRVIMNFPLALTPLPEIARRKRRTGGCGVRGILGILGTGEIALCGIGQTIPELVYGRLGEDSIRDIWLHHPKILALRRDLEDLESFPALCRDCIHVRSCRTGCVAQNYMQSGHLVQTSPICEEAASRGIFPETRIRSMVHPNGTTDKGFKA